MWKKQLTGAAIACALLLAGMMPVYAGGINAAEQRIVDYYNGTVTHNGKTYRFTEEAKQKAYNRLIDDDMDLTEREVDNAIRQANANLQRGIDEGYMVEVTDTDSDSGTDTEEPGTESTQTPGNQQEEPGSGQNPADQEAGGASTDNSNGQPGSANTTNGEDMPGSRPSYNDAQKTDVQKLLKDALEEGEYATIQTGSSKGEEGGKSDWAVTVEQFLKGTVDIVAKDGDVILSGTLPVKNTGYFTGGVVVGAILFAGILCIALTVIAIRRKKGYFSMPIITSAAGILAFAVFAGGFLESEAGKWKSVWILGTPEYTYAADMQRSADDGTWISPLQGEQYGELSCEEIGLKAPLYYGDTDEVFEQGAGTYVGGSLPGKGGEILIGGHDVTFFAPLESVREGMVFSLKTAYGEYEYQVTGTKTADVMEYKQGHPDTEELVLYTCYPFGAEERLRSERFFVYAKKVSGPEIGD